MKTIRPFLLASMLVLSASFLTGCWDWTIPERDAEDADVDGPVGDAEVESSGDADVTAYQGGSASVPPSITRHVALM